MRVAEKWDGRMPNVGAAPGTWKERARRAEAEAAAARSQVVASELQSAARLKEMTESASWRLTEPLRRINALRRALRRR
jgi:hypothetical protein